MESIPIQIIELLKYSYSIAKALLLEQDEFYPFGVNIDYEGNINQRLIHSMLRQDISIVMLMMRCSRQSSGNISRRGWLSAVHTPVCFDFGEYSCS